MKTHLKIIASEMLSMAADEFSNHGCNDLPTDLINKLKPFEKEICEAVRSINGNTDEWPERLEMIGDSALMDYASKAIAGYTACQEEDRWISVNDRMPDSNEVHQSDYVICINYIGTGSTPFVAWYDHGYEAWTVAHHHANSEPATVTHWQPMVSTSALIEPSGNPG